MVTFVRDGKKVAPTCPKCGCRLEMFVNDFFVTLRHFGIGPRDARGCICTHINTEWTYSRKNVSHLGYC